MSAVEWKTLGEVATIARGVRVVKSDLDSEGMFPVYQNSLLPLGYKDISNRLANTTYVICAGAAGDVGFSLCDFWAADDCSTIECKDMLISKYVYYFLLLKQFDLKSKVRKASIPRLSNDVLKHLEIPIPSLSKQQAIVSHLDAFTTLISSLESELEKRRKQYEHYRNQLLEFEGVDGVEWKTMGDIGDVCMCKRIMKEDTSEQGDIPFFKIGTFGGKADAFISYELYEKYKNEYSYPKKGDILISASGTIGRLVVFDGNDAYFQDSNIVWIDNNEELVLNAYLKYYYQIVEWKTDGGTIKRLYNNNLRATRIAIPSLATQQSIVEKLATFEQLNQSLETEIKLRKQQYEYYREKLLTFE